MNTLKVWPVFVLIGILTPSFANAQILGDGYLFGRAEAWGSSVDDDDSNNFGFSMGFNTGYELDGPNDIGFQVGISQGIADITGREDGNEDSAEYQTFFTIGLFKKGNKVGDMTGGLVYDYLIDNFVGEDGDDKIHLGQFRGQIGLITGEGTEIGLWGTMGMQEDELQSSYLPAIDKVETTDKLGLYYLQQIGLGTFRLGGGYADDPGEWYIDLSGVFPLDDNWVLDAGFAYMNPSTRAGEEPGPDGDGGFEERAWGIHFGLTLFFDGHNGNPRGKWHPVMPVANNENFMMHSWNGQ